ncbi:flocculation protein FLO11-like [Seriola dumerili]|uniref:flocculation protein FLO11-like n=1 Tax=Seriola dumerili TaxID=41447 RepID=UPI000BBF1892|nr:flocculation protein FLO11-like [Seriola dumerili]XP_022612797.1 flocculation protein FLO11-like [Seriola dumerili]
MTELEASGVGEHPPPYMIFLVVFLFFLTGLLGFLICHLLKKKGYRCRTGDIDDEEEEEEKLGRNADDEDEENQDTVEQILKCIIENEANMEAFNEMLGSHNICVRHDPRLRKESIGGVPPHHHTVHSGADHTSCHLCAQVRSKKGRRHSRTPRSKQRPGEQTVFSVGRFRVTHTDKKLHGSPNTLVSSGDQLDQSQDSEERKEGGYNLRSMFKDVRPSSENANGIAPPVGKRRKSMTIFGLRRGSDPIGIKAVEGAGRETGGVKFSIQQQPVVEELVQTETSETASERGSRPGSRPDTELSKNQSPASPQHEAKMAGSEKQAHGPSPDPEDGSKRRPSHEPHTNLTLKPSVGITVAPAPSSLLIPSSTTTSEKRGHDKVLMEAFDPEPLQTSTPIVPVPGSLPGFTPAVPADPAASCSSTDFPVIQTPPNPSSNPDLEPGFSASLALISLGSSPPSSFPINTPSSASSLKTSPMPSEAASSRGLTLSPKTPSGRAVSSQSPIPSKTTKTLQTQTSLSPVLIKSPKPDTRPHVSTASPANQNPSFKSSPCLTLKSGNVMSVTSMTQGDMVSSPLSVKVQELEARTPTTEVKRAGILKTAKLSPGEGGFKGSALSSPSDQLSKDRLSSLPVSPSSPLSPSSPVGSRVSSMTIVKASPDSKREFSVITMVEDEGASTKDNKLVASELGVESEKAEVSPAAGQRGEVSLSGTRPPESQRGETPAAEVRPPLSQERDNIVEMEDIRDCKVTKEQEAERREEVEVHTQD